MKKLDYYIFIAKSMLIACMVLLGTVGVPFAVIVEAAFNPEINYQGKLGDSSGSTVTDGTYQIVFNLYTVSSGGSPIWTETRSGVDEVQVTKGLFSVMLGEVQSLTGINWNQTLYLGVTIEADAEMTPRKKLGTVPSAFEAQRLEGLASTSFIRSDTANATNTTNTALILTQNGTGDVLNLFDGSNEVFSVIDGGNVGIGSSSPWAKLSIDQTSGGSTPLLSIASSTSGTGTTSVMHLDAYGRLSLGTSTQNSSRFAVQVSSGNALQVFNSSGTSVFSVDSFGNLNVSAAITTSNNQITGSQIVSNNSLSAGSGTELAPSIKFNSDSDTGIYNPSANNLAFVTGGAEALRIIASTSGSYVGIGSTTPVSKLTVSSGDAWIDGLVKASYFVGTSTATSTFGGGVQTTALNVTGSATSTFAQGINLTTGCFAVNGTCVGAGTGSGTVNSGTLGQVAFYDANGTAVSGTSTLTILDGKVGIGTTSPYAVLSVNIPSDGSKSPFIIASSTTNTNVFEVTSSGKVKIGNPSFANFLSIETSGQTGNNSTISLRNSVDNDEVSISMQNTGGSSWTTGVDSSGNYTIANYPGSLSTGQLITVASTTGYFGIGTTTPGAKLSVGGDAIIDGFTRASYFVATSTTATSTFAGGFSAASSLYALQNGNVGIGTSSPVAKLDVVGSINFANNSSLTQAGVARIDGNGRFIATLGSVSTAGFQFFNDANTGIFSPSGDILAITTGGSERLRVDAAGLVGIGSSTPYAQLSIHSSGGSATPLFTIASSTGGAATSTALHVDAYGRTGLGTTSPFAKLSIQGDASALYAFAAYGGTGGSGVAGGGFLFQGGVGGSGATGGGFVLNAGAGGSGGAGGSLSLTAGTAGSAGTAGAVSITGGAPQTGGTGGAINLTGGGSSGGTGGAVNISGGAPAGGTGGNLYLYGGIPSGGTNGKVLLGMNSSGTFSGNVGIATATPAFRLSVGSGDLLVDGFVKASYFIGTSTATSTFGGAITVSSGAGTSTFAGGFSSAALNVTGSATSTFAQGINLASGCFAVNGTGVSGGAGSGTVNSGTLGQVAFYDANGTAVSGTSTLFISSGSNIGIGTSSPYGKLSVKGNGTGTGKAFVISDSADAEIFSQSDNGAVVIRSSASQMLSVQQSSGNEIFGVRSSGVDFNNAGGYSTVGGAGNLGARFNISTLNNGGTAGLAITGVASPVSSQNLLEINSVGDLGGDYFVVGYQGNVGIGTTTPGAKLSVGGGDAIIDGFVKASYFNATSTTATSTFSGNMSIGNGLVRGGTGTSQFLYNSWAATNWDLAYGTAASPLTGAGPSFKISRTDEVSSTTCGTNQEDAECVAALSIKTKSLSNGDMQSTALHVSAESSSIKPGTDAFGIHATGRVTGSGVGIGGGAYLVGRRDTDTGMANGAEVSAWNYTTTDCTYSTGGISNCVGLWAASRGLGASNKLSVGLQVGSGDATSKWLVGLGFTSNGVASTTISDDSNSETSYKISGTHTYAFVTSSTGGRVGIGTLTPLNIVHISSSSPSLRMTDVTSTGSLQLSVAGGTGTFSDFASAGDTVLRNNAAGDNIVLTARNAGGSIMFGTGAADTEKMRIDSTGNVGIGTTSPYAKLSVAGQVVGEYFTATSTTATSTFAGGVNVGKSLVLANYNCSANANGGALTTDSSGYVICSDDSTGLGTSQWSDSGSDIYFNTGKVGIGSSTPSYALTVTGTTSVGTLIVGNPTTLPNALINVATSVDSYVQVAIQNTSAGTNASADFVAANDLGSDTKYYVDLGINSSTYSNPSYTITGPNDAYLYNSDGALAIGTASSTNTNAVLKFHTGGTLASNERVRIDTDGDVGIGTTSVSERLQIEGGNVLIGKRNDVTGSWSAQTNAIGTIATGGTSSIGSTTAMAVYNGSLYVGTEKASGAEVYRYNGTPGSWTKVSSTTAGTIAEDVGSTGSITSVSAMAVYNGYLYLGTTKTDAAEVYRYDGNSTWTRISSSTAGAIGGSATTTTIDSVSAMVVHGGQLFVGTAESARAEVYRYDVADVSTAVGQNRWTRVSTTNSPGTIGADAAVNSINSLISFNGTLYAATSKASLGSIYQYRGYAGTGSGFTRFNTNAAGQFTGNGTTITGITNVRKMAVYNGQLYVGIDNGANTARIVRLDSNPASTTATWQVMSSTTAGTIFSATTTAQNIDRVTTMAIYKDDLYIGTLEGGLASVYKLNDGTTWDLVSSSSFGYIGSTSSTTVSAIGAMQVYDDNLWVGTGDPDGVEIFKYNVVEGESYALKFEATTDDAGEGELNGLKNTGSIMFVAEESAWSVNGNTNTGKFVVSHGINTAIGAYDVAEDYPTRDDTLVPGDVVSIDSAEKVMVKKSKGKNDQNIIGIFSSEPALRLSQVDTHIDGARAIPVALVGRVPVNVTTENGKIEIGDYLVASNEGGKAAKATKPGRVIGRALSAFEGRDGEKAQVMTYIGVETITWNDIAQAEETTEELTSGEADTSTDSVTEFVAAVNEAVADVAYAMINKMDNLTLVITNKLTAVVASIKDLFVSKLTLIPGGSITVPRGANQIAGSAVIKAGDRDVRIDNNQIDDFSLISITPTSEVNSPLYVASKTAGEGFLVRIDKVSDKDITFDWFSIKTYDFEEQTTVINDDQEEVSSDDTVEDATSTEDDTDTDSNEGTTNSDETTDEQGDTDVTSSDTTTEESSVDSETPDSNDNDVIEDDTTSETSSDAAPDTTEGDSSSSDTSSSDTSSDSSSSGSSESSSGGESDSGSASSGESSSGGSSSDSGSSSSEGDGGGASAE